MPAFGLRASICFTSDFAAASIFIGPSNVLPKPRLPWRHYRPFARERNSFFCIQLRRPAIVVHVSGMSDSEPHASQIEKFAMLAYSDAPALSPRCERDSGASWNFQDAARKFTQAARVVVTRQKMAATRDDFLKELESTAIGECSYPETRQHMPLQSLRETQETGPTRNSVENKETA